ncbi:MAG: hypothetical protein GDA41_08555 [Rhodospirillales bacterium]|nr:hypothetical protein [Rhodospirillales bacterium]
MSVDANACTVRVAREDPAAAEAQNKSYAAALKKNHTAFSLMKAPNCAVVAVEDILRGHIKGFFLLPVGRAQLGEIVADIPADWVEALRAGQAGLILDHSTDGHVLSNNEQLKMTIWHQQLKALGIPPSRLVYVTQNRNFQDTYNLWCEQTGVEDRISIVNYDYFLSWFCRRSWPDPAAALTKKVRHFENRNRIKKRFVCLNHKPRFWRIALLTRLIKDNYWDDGFISFGGLELEVTTVEEPTAKFGSSEVEKFRKRRLATGSEAYLEALAGKGRVLFGKTPGGEEAGKREVRRTCDTSTYLYRRSAFTLVTETNMRPNADRITEKSLKPMANCHPAILFANYGALSLLRSLGFKTFEPWIDEGYDAIEDPETRFLAAYEAFRQFYKTAWDRVREDRELRDVLLYNAEHAMIGLPRLYDETLDPKLCREIASVLEDT